MRWNRKKNGRIICISGFSELTRGWVNEQEPEVEIWAMNEAHIYLERPASRYFQIHPRTWNSPPEGQKGWVQVGYCENCGWGTSAPADDAEKIAVVKKLSQKHADDNPTHDVNYGTDSIEPDGFGRPKYHLEFLKRCGVPVYTYGVDERIPTSVAYPYDEIVERYGTDWIGDTKRPYLTSTAAYMLALAVYEHDNGETVDEIRLAGIELSIGTEYFHQKPCVEFWLGMAMGRGIRIGQSPYGTSLLVGQIYAREHGESLFPESMKSFKFTEVPADTPSVVMLEDREGNPVGL